ncbi:uncharacterized protein TNIN_426731 [Trichonephila inaurata madagascariensis]|uniref:Uncharacterized protein n=1 Tax=Trichonephila inaurata madagascariensis TaxID=2747483 RepID=A0A8X7CS10_9ARAC|nr:uncharacterized protein TNIN_426731 [Trichonephila inaurata madagascariensis]
MNWIKGFSILIVFASGPLILAAGSTHLKLPSPERYEHCVVRNLSDSSMFTEEDWVKMNKIVTETSGMMQKLGLDPTNAVNSRTMLRLFTAALANVVVDIDSTKRVEREEACISALETCSIALAEKAGSELVKEVRKIFASMNNERSYLDDRVDNETPAASKSIKEYLEKSSAQTSSKDFDVKKRSKRAYATTFGMPATSGKFQTNPSLESILADVMLKSNTFNNIFKNGISQEDAIFYSRAMVAAGLSGYRYDIIDETLDSVTNAISMLGYMAEAVDYAYTIARSLTSVLTAHDLIFYADGLGIGNALVSKLESMVQPSSTFSFPVDFKDSSSSSFGGVDSSFASFQTGMAAPAQVNPGYVEPSSPFNSQDRFQFQNNLFYYLSQSDALSEAFCNGPFPGIYNVINSALSDYGWYIASTAATAVSNSLSGLPTEAACTQYADVISEIISNVFQNNDLLETADAQAIVTKIAFNISPNLGIQSQGSAQQSYSGGFGSFELNPSFSDFSYPAAQAPAANPQFPAEKTPYFEIKLSVPDIQFDKQQFPAASSSETNPSEFTIRNAAPSIIQAIPSILQPSVQIPSSVNSSNTQITPKGQNSTTTADKISSPLTNLPKNNSTNSGKRNQTSGAPPVILEPGPVISGKPAIKLENSPNKNISVTPAVMETSKAPEVTTPVPVTTVLYTTPKSVPEPTTPNPFAAAVDRAVEDQAKLSALLTGGIDSFLRGLNSTIGNNKKLPDSQKPLAGVKTKPTEEPTSSKSIPQTPKPATSSPVDVKGKSVPGSTSLQPSFGTPASKNRPSNADGKKKPEPNYSESYSTTELIQNVSLVAISSIQFIRSQEFQLHELCNMVHDLAFIVNLPPLDYCSEIALIDFLLHVLNAVAVRIMV